MATSVAPSRRSLRDNAILRLHRLADRFELLPPEFGERTPLDETDPDAVAGEWIRCLRLWADYSPEQIFALKVGAALLVVTLVALAIIIGWMA